MSDDYATISNFGSNQYDPTNNPLTYYLSTDLDNLFMHGGHSQKIGKYSKAGQSYMAEYCAAGWDSFCEAGSCDTNRSFPNNLENCGFGGDTACLGLTQGEILIKNTAAKKYLTEMLNCVCEEQPFDPTVASSPMYKEWVKTSHKPCVPIYEVNPLTIDNDVVMDKILTKPMIAPVLLLNIYNTMKRKGTLPHLNGTKLGNYYNTNRMFSSMGGTGSTRPPRPSPAPLPRPNSRPHPHVHPNSRPGPHPHVHPNSRPRPGPQHVHPNSRPRPGPQHVHPNSRPRPGPHPHVHPNSRQRAGLHPNSRQCAGPHPGVMNLSQNNK